MLLAVFSAQYSLALLVCEDLEYRQQGWNVLMKCGLSLERINALILEDQSSAIRFVLSKMADIDLTPEEIERSSRLMEDKAIHDYISRAFSGWIIDNSRISIQGAVLGENKDEP